MPGYFIAQPPRIEIVNDKILKNKEAKRLIEDIPLTISNNAKVEAIQALNLAIREIRAGKMVEKQTVKNVTRMIVEEVITNHEHTLLNLMDIREHDEYTFTHSINVCILATLIGIRKRLPREELEELAIGALLHDLGKVMIPEAILTKPSRLSLEEFEQIKRHPFYSYNILRMESDIGEISKAVAYEHHERYDGSGYPRRLSVRNMHQLTPIVSLADIYDALTTDRPYRKGFLPHDALRIIISQVERDFPMEVVQTFLKYISIYPLGSLVELNTGEIGLVIKVSKTSLIRPVVRLLLDSKGKMLSQINEIDLEHDLHRFVVGAVSEEALVTRIS